MLYYCSILAKLWQKTIQATVRVFQLLAKRRFVSLGSYFLSRCNLKGSEWSYLGVMMKSNSAVSHNAMHNLNFGTEYHELVTLDNLHDLMVETRNLRRKIVSDFLEAKPLCGDTVAALEKAFLSLEFGLTNDYKVAKRSFSSSAGGDAVTVCLKNEITELSKDLSFIKCLNDGRFNYDSFFQYMAGCQGDTKLFAQEVDVLSQFLCRVAFDDSSCCKKCIDIFISDWDGTLKNYGNNYMTCVQPLYSGIIIAVFVKKFTGFSAVLTAGPLQQFGILDLVCVPTSYLTFGGSWGQEWFIFDSGGGVRVANEEASLSELKMKLLNDLSDRMMKILQEKPLFAQFSRIGSGFQKKIDRLTLGIQTISHDVPDDLSELYFNEIMEQLKAVDPDRQIFTVHRTALDVELIVKSASKEVVFDKADGVNYLLNKLSLDVSKGTVLICGDTLSDLPMVENVKKSNPEGTFAIFVDPAPEVRERLSQLLINDHYCIASCPEALHCAMAKIALVEGADMPQVKQPKVSN